MVQPLDDAAHEISMKKIASGRRLWGVADLFGVVVMIHLFAEVALFVLCCEWLILAAVLDPTRYLPFGASVISGMILVYGVFVQMRGISERMRDEVRDTFGVNAAEVRTRDGRSNLGTEALLCC